MLTNLPNHCFREVSKLKEEVAMFAQQVESQQTKLDNLKTKNNVSSGYCQAALALFTLTHTCVCTHTHPARVDLAGQLLEGGG